MKPHKRNPLGAHDVLKLAPPGCADFIRVLCQRKWRDLYARVTRFTDRLARGGKFQFFKYLIANGVFEATTGGRMEGVQPQRRQPGAERSQHCSSIHSGLLFITKTRRRKNHKGKFSFLSYRLL